MTITIKQIAAFAATTIVVATGIAWYLTTRFPLTVESDETGYITKILAVATIIGVLAGLTTAAWVGHYLRSRLVPVTGRRYTH